MTDRAWKRQERAVAALVGSQRNANDGQHRTDIDAGPWAIEHKARRSLPAWFTHAMQQAVSGAREGRTPLVVLSLVSQGRKAQRYVVFRMQDFLEWHE